MKEMLNMGSKMSEGTIAPAGKKDEISYPSVTLSKKIPDELKKMKVGAEVNCRVRMKKTSESMSKHKDMPAHESVSMDIMEMGVEGVDEDKFKKAMDDTKLPKDRQASATAKFKSSRSGGGMSGMSM